MKTPNWFLKKTIIAYILLPLSVIYFLITNLVYWTRRIFQKSSIRPVICIGNIFTGGTGKTPIVMEIAKRLNAPVVMRGYKKSKTGKGDEAKMLENAGISVYVGNRAKNIKTLNIKKSKTPIIMDDGFQNPSVRKDISILVFDSQMGFGNGFLLPAGPLRELPFAIARCDAIIIIRRGADINIKIPNYNIPVFYATNKTIMPPVSGNFVAFAGIGYPQKFFDALPKSCADTKSFPDHHEFSKSDLNELFLWAQSYSGDLITTEKDWVRLPVSVQKKILVAKLETVIEPDFWKWLGNHNKLKGNL